MKRISTLLVLLVLAIVLSSCAAGFSNHDDSYRAGFFRGIWHGWIAPISLIWHFFNPNVRIYEPFNTGWWYDFGFYLAIAGGFGALSFTRRSR